VQTRVGFFDGVGLACDVREKEHISASRARSSNGLIRPEGLEPPTPGSEDRYSIQLSYGRANQTAIEAVWFGRSDGIRTRDPQDHNLVR
jgi:hypothetical protein